ncbi:hypothetical protein ACHAWT_009820 [Skeletonema menzelii]
MELLFITVNRAVGVWLHMRSILNYQAALFQDAEKERQLLNFGSSSRTQWGPVSFKLRCEGGVSSDDA